MARMKLLVGVAAISGAIKEIAGVAQNLQDRVQCVAASIIAHAAGPGNGDVSLALDLCKMVKRYPTLNTNFLVGYLRHFGSMNVNLRADNGKGKVSLLSRDAKGYRGFDVDGAKANNWYEAVDSDGNRAPWYQGPTPETYTPGGIGDVADSIHNFVKRTAERLDGTKTIGDKEVPLFEISKEDREQLDNALAFMDRLSATIARKERVAELTAAREAEIKAAEQDTEVVGVLTSKAPATEEQREPAVA